MANQAEALRYAVRVPVLLKYFGQLCLVVAALALPPAGASLASGEASTALRYVTLILPFALLGVGLLRIQAKENVQLNEAMVLVASIFLVTPLAMTYPLMGAGLSFSDALFEAVSGVTTTGLSTLRTVEDKSNAFLFARAWMQWYGGLGIVVLSLALLVRPGMAAKRLSAAQVGEEDLVGGTKAHARRVLNVYALLTGCGIVLLLLTGTAPFDAVVYALAAVSTGGFSPHDGSLSALGGPIPQWAVTITCFAGAVPLSLYRRPSHKRGRPELDVFQTKSVVVAGAVVTLLLAFCLRSVQGFSWTKVFHVAPVLAFSAQTTAGFSNMNVSTFHGASKLVLILAMALGGGVGSTAGGIKILRVLTILSILRLVIKKTAVARHAVLVPRLRGSRVEQTEIHEVVLIVLLFVAVVLLSWFCFVLAGYETLDSLFEVVSAAGTVGLSAGVTRSGLPALLKGVLCADMLLGRLEILPWLVMLYPGTWFGRRI
jgi:trk system potassium uptake protein TrkH